MTKIETLVFEYEHCGECFHSITTDKTGYRCSKTRRIIKDLWGEIPSWCPLEEKK